jgi:hypothetical protein
VDIPRLVRQPVPRTINAVQGPNGNILVSDQVADAVFEFTPRGSFVGIFASQGLDNIRGIDSPIPGRLGLGPAPGAEGQVEQEEEP